ncbi:MAG: PD-(D/E)XK nuclease family protein [Chloroflexi bacterium]|nr:PD-(D/E)XK nuclease family protein [Chloroflexota bacterium]
MSPSEQARGEQRADVLFAPDRGEGLDLGAAIHELFEKVSWMEEVDVEALIDEWRESTRFQDHLKEQAVKHFQQALASDEIRATLSRPPGNVELWRERPFEVVLGDRWVTGVFDRVVIAKDSSGRAVQAEIIDFKSDDVISDDEIVGEAKRYAPQMSLYGSALSHMLQLGPPRIGLRLVFTNPGKVHVLG